jgi:hypothetical protein
MAYNKQLAEHTHTHTPPHTHTPILTRTHSETSVRGMLTQHSGYYERAG